MYKIFKINEEKREESDIGYDFVIAGKSSICRSESRDHIAIMPGITIYYHAYECLSFSKGKIGYTLSQDEFEDSVLQEEEHGVYSLVHATDCIERAIAYCRQT